MSFWPVNGLIFVKPDKPIERQGAIILPASSVKQTMGIVFRSSSSYCKPGDRVIYARFWPIEIDGRDYLAINEKELVAVDQTPVISAAEKELAGLTDEDIFPPPPPTHSPEDNSVETCVDVLLLTDVLEELAGKGDYSPLRAIVAAWSIEQRRAAIDWAGAVHLSASDNDDVVVPPMPEHVRQTQKKHGAGHA